MRALALASLLLAAFARAGEPRLGAGELKPFGRKDFDALRVARRTVVLQFHADNCELCLRQRQTLEHIARGSSKTDPVYLQADFEREAELRRQFEVTAVSTLLVFKGERLIGRVTGLFSEEDIRAFVHRSLMRSRAKPRARPKASLRPER